MGFMQQKMLLDNDIPGYIYLSPYEFIAINSKYNYQNVHMYIYVCV